MFEDRFKEKITGYNERAVINIESNAEQRYIRDHLQKAFSLEDSMLGKKKFEFANYMVEDPMYGPRIKMDEWVKDFGDFANKLRKWIDGTDINPETTIEGWDYEKKEWGHIKIGKSMIGEDILQFPEFVTNGKVDYDKINKNKKLFVKVCLAGVISAQILQFRQSAEWNRNPRYSYAMLKGILESIENIPGNFIYKEGDARGGHSTEKFFPPKVYKWILTKTGSTILDLDGMEALKEFFFGSVGKEDGLFAGTAEGFALFVKACIEGVGK